MLAWSLQCWALQSARESITSIFTHCALERERERDLVVLWLQKPDWFHQREKKKVFLPHPSYPLSFTSSETFCMFWFQIWRWVCINKRPALPASGYHQKHCAFVCIDVSRIDRTCSLKQPWFHLSVLLSCPFVMAAICDGTLITLPARKVLETAASGVRYLQAHTLCAKL